jgi:hypothetical protein
MTKLLAAALVFMSLTVEAGSVRFVENAPRNYDFGDQASLPPTFGRGEFTLELWFKADDRFPVGETDRGTIGQLTNWSDLDLRPYASGGWWHPGNWLLDGHSRPAGFDTADSREGTFSLQFYGGGRLRWMFADDALVVPIGKVWTVQAAPATKTASLLDGQWHHVACVRRWVEESKAQLELWIDGKMVASQIIPQRVNMRKYWDSLPHPDDPKELGGWCWGAEVMTAWEFYFTQYEDYKGLMDELRFWDRARTADELASSWRSALRGNEKGLVGWFDFEEREGDRYHDRLDRSRTIVMHRATRESRSPENAPVL